MPTFGKIKFIPFLKSKREMVTPKGLVDYLEGQADLRSVMHQTEIPNLSVIPSGYCPSNPSELLHSKYMSILLKRCQQEGFHIILDAPPVLPRYRSRDLGHQS